MSKIYLTDLVVKSLPLPDKGQRLHWDESLPGFGLRVSRGGAKTWIVLHPRAKVRTQQTIGRYPLISLQQARGEARRRLAEQTLGKRSAKAISWNTASKEFLAEIGGERRASTHRQYKRVLEGMRFGATHLSDIMPDDMQKKLDGKTPEAFPAARAFFNWARRKKYVLEHPMEGMKAPAAYKARKRVLSDAELRKIWTACGDDRYGRLVKLLMLTGQRLNEINNLAQAMVGKQSITLPGELTKNGREHTFPLGKEAETLLVLPIKWGGLSKSKRELDKQCGVLDWTLHDLRRTFRTNLGMLGVRPDIAERLVNHVNARSNMEEVYDRYTYMPEMRAAIELWEAHMQALLQDGRLAAQE